jgi:dTDP-4-amino-4,6-dideoxygalactose transaminase
MMDIQAALGIHQLARIERQLSSREAIWHGYESGLAEMPLTLPAPTEPGTRHARHLFTVLVDREICGTSRDDLQLALKTRGIGTSVHFKALHLHPYYAERFELERGMFPEAEFISDRTLSLPLSPALTEPEIDRVIEAVTESLVSGAW